MQHARPSLVDALFKHKKEFKPWDRNPLGLATANQLNALRDYIKELEDKNEFLRGTPDSDGIQDGSVTDSGGSGCTIPRERKNSDTVG